jgi:hypothetical protein
MNTNTFSPLKSKISSDVNPNGANASLQMLGDAMARQRGRDMQTYSKNAHF